MILVLSWGGGDNREAITSIFAYMEVSYNRQRGHTLIGGFSPAEIEELDLKRSA